MKKSFLVVITFVSFIVLSVAFTKAPPGYKNLKVLPQDISKQALDSVMHNYSRSLGVKCGFCHVRNEELKTWDMANDAKPEKQIARKMMLMEKGINSTYFPPEEGEKNAQVMLAVTCYTCHKGDAMPLAAPEMKMDSLNRR